MADFLDAITHLIQSPPGVLVAGGLLAGAVWKSSERVEAVLTDQTKLEIADWLVATDLAKPPEAVQAAMTNLFGYIFGKAQASWRCIFASAVLTGIASALFIPLAPEFFSQVTDTPSKPKTFLACSLVIVLPVFWTIRCLRTGARRIIRSPTLRSIAKPYFVTCFQSLLSLVPVFYLSRPVAAILKYPNERFPAYGELWLSEYVGLFIVFLLVCIIPVALLSVVASVLAVRMASSLNFGFDWFNRHFDIKKKPLQSIGLVAGVLVAVLYWTAALLVRLWK